MQQREGDEVGVFEEFGLAKNVQFNNFIFPPPNTDFADDISRPRRAGEPAEWSDPDYRRREERLLQFYKYGNSGPFSQLESYHQDPTPPTLLPPLPILEERECLDNARDLKTPPTVAEAESVSGGSEYEEAPVNCPSLLTFGGGRLGTEDFTDSGEPRDDSRRQGRKHIVLQTRAKSGSEYSTAGHTASSAQCEESSTDEEGSGLPQPSIESNQLLTKWCQAGSQSDGDVDDPAEKKAHAVPVQRTRPRKRKPRREECREQSDEHCEEPPAKKTNTAAPTPRLLPKNGQDRHENNSPTDCSHSTKRACLSHPDLPDRAALDGRGVIVTDAPRPERPRAPNAFANSPVEAEEAERWTLVLQQGCTALVQNPEASGTSATRGSPTPRYPSAGTSASPENECERGTTSRAGSASSGESSEKSLGT